MYKRECRGLEETAHRILRPNLEKHNLFQLLPNAPTYYHFVKHTSWWEATTTTALTRHPSRRDPSYGRSCGGPTDRISWFSQKILSPLLHMYHLILRTCNSFWTRQYNFAACPRLAYQSFDIVAFYTNLDIRRAMEACISLLQLLHRDLQPFGLIIAKFEVLLRVVVNVNFSGCTTCSTSNGKSTWAISCNWIAWREQHYHQKYSIMYNI